MPPDGPVGIVGEGTDETDGDTGGIDERLTGVGALVNVSCGECACCTTGRDGAAPQEDASGRVVRSWPNEPLPPLIP